MLVIDNKEYVVTKQEIFVASLTINGDKGYDVYIELEFEDNDKKGYLNLSAGYENENDINSFVNKVYTGVPYEINNKQINIFEVFDTNKFLDTEIESEIVLRLDDVKDDKINASIEVNDELVKIKYEGELNIVEFRK